MWQVDETNQQNVLLARHLADIEQQAALLRCQLQEDNANNARLSADNARVSKIIFPSTSQIQLQSYSNMLLYWLFAKPPGSS